MLGTGRWIIIVRPSRRRFAPPQNQDKFMMALRQNLILRSPRAAGVSKDAERRSSHVFSKINISGY
jgi:hypothetical protein